MNDDSDHFSASDWTSEPFPIDGGTAVLLRYRGEAVEAVEVPPALPCTGTRPSDARRSSHAPECK
jgi:hypothetical protein